jgi:hypothetical protein
MAVGGGGVVHRMTTNGIVNTENIITVENNYYLSYKEKILK